MSQVLLHALLHEEYAMQVVGHELQGHHLHLGVVVGDAHPRLLHRLA